MAPSPDPKEFDTPEPSLRGKIAGAIEQFCLMGIRVSTPFFLPLGVLFVAYLAGGYTLITAEIWSPPFEFLSLTSDIYFVWLVFISGANICLGTGSLIGLVFLTGGEGRYHNDVSILASFIGFGFGAGAIRVTYTTIFAFLV